MLSYFFENFPINLIGIRLLRLIIYINYVLN